MMREDMTDHAFELAFETEEETGRIHDGSQQSPIHSTAGLILELIE